LHVGADRLRPLLQGEVGVPFPFPEIFRLRIDAQSGVVISERVGRVLLGEPDISLEAQGSEVSAVAGQGVRCGGLSGLDPTAAGRGQLRAASDKWPTWKVDDL